MSRIHESPGKGRAGKGGANAGRGARPAPQVVSETDVPVFSCHRVAVETNGPAEQVRSARAADGAILQLTICFGVAPTQSGNLIRIACFVNWDRGENRR